MRSLPAALQTAQQAVTGQPVISAILRAKRGAAARLDVTTLFADTPIIDAPYAVCLPASGDVLLVAGDNGGTIHAYRRPNSTGVWGADVPLAPPGALSINSIALSYSGDWLALFGWADANLSYVASAIYGNGVQQTAN